MGDVYNRNREVTWRSATGRQDVGRCQVLVALELLRIVLQHPELGGAGHGLRVQSIRSAWPHRSAAPGGPVPASLRAGSGIRAWRSGASRTLKSLASRRSRSSAASSTMGPAKGLFVNEISAI